ncbi:uncharacterized protein [Halyomorpha halys]|uniref:uncharacterized protein n=1 Tax=Halyomorpha halys TaxID=286706 RepID=UPI0034D17264
MWSGTWTPRDIRRIEEELNVYTTLCDHLRVNHLDKGLEPDDAMNRAIAAYNHFIHTVTGFSPFEVLFGMRGRRRDYRGSVVEGETILDGSSLRKVWGRVKSRVKSEKTKRVARQNTDVRDVTGKIGIGTIVCRRVGTNRSKEVLCYEGPFRVIVIREHNVFTIKSVKEPKKRRTVHIEQLKLPMRGPNNTMKF